MESRFSHLRQRDSSMSMLRVKLSRRRSESQKENRTRAVNSRRQLDNLLELDCTAMDASVVMGNVSLVQERAPNIAKAAKEVAGIERLKQLERWKERKALEKEKEKRAKEKKGVFKVGLYRPQNSVFIAPLPPAQTTTATQTRAKVATSQSSHPQNTRVTRSMKQQQPQKPPKQLEQSMAVSKVEPAVGRQTRSRVAVNQPAPITRTKAATVEPVVRAASTRSANRPPTAAVPKAKDKTTTDRRTRTKTNVKVAAPPPGSKSDKVTLETVLPVVSKEPEPEEAEPDVEAKACPPPLPAACTEEEERMLEAPAPAEPPPPPASFAPQGYVFQAPGGLSSFKFDPLTPRSADSFLLPSVSFTLPPALSLDLELQAEPTDSAPPTSPVHSLAPVGPQEPEHDVPYFRSEISTETATLTSLCGQWECKFQDESIPEEMRDCMRTAVGQARLLMKERFAQFSGLVDDCELGRGEKIITCMDLQGFWDMVYFQVEDVYRKFCALKEAEARNWVEENKPPPRQKKAVKKPPSAAAPKQPGTNAAAKSRLAAVKAAMKARQQAAEAVKVAQACDTEQGPELPAGAMCGDNVLFDGGFYQVESPARLPNSARRSARLSNASLPHSSLPPSATPERVTRRSAAMLRSSPALRTQTPSHCGLTPMQSHCPGAKTPRNLALKFAPVEEVHAHLDGSPTVPGQHNIAPCGDGDAIPECRTAPQAKCIVSDAPAVLTQGGPAEATGSASPSRVPEPCTPSFTPSPCSPPSTPARGSAAEPNLDIPDESQESMSQTPDGSVIECIPGLDFERYLRPTERSSLSPRETSAIERLPMVVDVEMESPAASPLPQEEAGGNHRGLHGVPLVLIPQTPQTVELDLLLFTPDFRDRISQSLCPADLMVFTPPSNAPQKE